MEEMLDKRVKVTVGIKDGIIQFIAKWNRGNNVLSKSYMITIDEIKTMRVNPIDMVLDEFIFVINRSL